MKTRSYRGDNDNWSSSTNDVYPGTDELVGDHLVIANSFTYYTWTLNVGAVDWLDDLTDNTLTLAINTAGYFDWFAIDLINPLRIPMLTIDYDEAALIPGDANHDGEVDGADYTIWADHYLQTDQTWEDGDFTGDGTVDGADYTLWADNFSAVPPELPTFSASAVPEPATIGLAGMGSVALVVIGFRRRSLRYSGPRGN